MKFTYYTDEKSTVVAITTFRGERFRAIAKCDPRDKFDLETGKKLAAARCEAIARKHEVKKRIRWEDEYREACEYLQKQRDVNMNKLNKEKAKLADAVLALNALEKEIM